MGTAKKIANHCNIKDLGQGFWVDAKKEVAGNNFKWSTGEVIDKDDPIWHEHNPSYDGLCVEFHKGGAINDWALNDVACQKMRSVVCEQGSTAALELEDGKKLFCHSDEKNRIDAFLY